MRFFAPIALVLAAPAVAETETTTPEYQLAACIHENDADLLVAIRDAESEDAFVENLQKGAALCEMTELSGFSMGRFFDAIAELIGAPSYEDAN